VLFKPFFTLLNCATELAVLLPQVSHLFASPWLAVRSPERTSGGKLHTAVQFQLEWRKLELEEDNDFTSAIHNLLCRLCR